MQILNTGYSNYSNGDLTNEATNILASLEKEPAATYYATVAEGKASVAAALALFEADIAKGNAPGAAEDRAITREGLITELTLLAATLENVTPGERAKLATTGYRLRKIPESDPTPTGTPQNVSVKPTGIPGQAKPSCNAVPHINSYQARATKDLGSGVFIETAPLNKIRDLLFTDLERGVDWFFEIRCSGPNGVGPWSDPAMMMVV